TRRNRWKCPRPNNKVERAGQSSSRRLATGAVGTPPSLRCASPSWDQAKTKRSARAAVSVQTDCGRYADSLAYERASSVAGSTEAGTRELRRLCPLFAERAQEARARRRGD